MSTHPLILNALSERRQTLTEPEGLELLKGIGISIPQSIFLTNSEEISTLHFPLFSGPKVVLKVVSHEILHKSDVGGIQIIQNDPLWVKTTLQEMERNFKGLSHVRGYTLSELIPYSPELGNELLINLRHTEDFGTLLTIGPGGIHTEFLNQHLKIGHEVAIFSVTRFQPAEALEVLKKLPITHLLTGKHRGHKPRLPLETLIQFLNQLVEFAKHQMPDPVYEFEINPCVLSHSQSLVALDAVVKLDHKNTAQRLKAIQHRTQLRPVHKIKNLLEPKTAAIIGVSDKMNPGRVMLKHLLNEGFPPQNISVVKPNTDTLDGCSCFPSIASLPQKVDLFMLAVSAQQVPGVITEIVENEKAESLIVIPGGLEEKQGSESIVKEMNKALERSRHSGWKGPVINGGNCLGIDSRPGKYNTLFIPDYKMPSRHAPEVPLALITQSGAFAVSRLSQLHHFRPRYTITMGNQMDLTVSDYLNALSEDPHLSILGVYLEGFKPFDGLRFLEALEKCKKASKKVILYRAGRTSAGAQATASHTASIAGQYAVTRQLSQRAGAWITESLEDFEDACKVCLTLKDRPLKGLKLGAISNAGFECVAFADNLGPFVLADFSEATAQRLSKSLNYAGISSIVDVHNPLDLTPMTNDLFYEEMVKTLMDAPEIDAVIVGVVPLSPAIQTLPPSEEHKENFNSEFSIVNRLVQLYQNSKKPLAIVVDSGRLYDPMALFLQNKGVPVYRHADRALRLMGQYYEFDRGQSNH